jgi:hypothetical protein
MIQILTLFFTLPVEALAKACGGFKLFCGFAVVQLCSSAVMKVLPVARFASQSFSEGW